jgi:hypothetical protein
MQQLLVYFRPIASALQKHVVVAYLTIAPQMNAEYHRDPRNTGNCKWLRRGFLSHRVRVQTGLRLIWQIRQRRILGIFTVLTGVDLPIKSNDAHCQ